MVTFGGSATGASWISSANPAARVAVTVTFAATPRSTSAFASFTASAKAGLSVTATPIWVSISRGGNGNPLSPAFTTSVTMTGLETSFPLIVALATTVKLYAPGATSPLHASGRKATGTTGWFGWGGGVLGTVTVPLKPGGPVTTSSIGPVKSRRAGGLTGRSVVSPGASAKR